MAKKDVVQDIFNGKVLNCWKDDRFVYLEFPWCIINFPIENASDVFKELAKLDKASKRKGKIRLKTKKDELIWEKEIDEILKSGKNETEIEKQLNLLSSYINDLEYIKTLIPSEKNQGFLNEAFTHILSNKPLPYAIITIFEIGQIYQENKKIFEEE